MYKVSDRIRLCNDIHSDEHIINKRMGWVIWTVQEQVIVAANPCFDFGNGFFNWIKVRGVWWQVAKADS
jgi:hypothetical protein